VILTKVLLIHQNQCATVIFSNSVPIQTHLSYKCDKVGVNIVICTINHYIFGHAL